MRRQCELLGIARSSVDYQPVPESQEDLRIKRILDEIYLIDPCLGSRRLVTVLDRDHGMVINRKKVQRLRREMGIEAIYCKPRTSIPDDGHRKYPYLLRNLVVERPDQVWCTDITDTKPRVAVNNRIAIRFFVFIGLSLFGQTVWIEPN